MLRIAAIIAFAALTLFALGCAAKAPELEGVVNKDKIPVYVNAAINEHQAIGGANTEGDDGNFYIKYWELKTADPTDKVVAFYEKALPQATKDKTTEHTAFTWNTFPGAEKGEYISVTVSNNGEILIGECLKLGKRKGH